MQRQLRVGVITSPHGLNGEVKVYPTTDSAARFLEIKDVFLKTAGGDKQTTIESARLFKGLALVKFACFESVEDVKNLHGTDIYIDRKDAQPLKEGEYYIADLIGCVVVTDEGRVLGKVKDVLQTGANDVYLVERTGPEGGKDILLPVIPECIRSVDIENERITAHILPGLLDL